MRRRPPGQGVASKSPHSINRLRRKLKLEALEPRLALTSLTLQQALGELSGHSGVCSCPICTGQGLETIPQEEVAASDLSAASPLSSLPQLHSNPGASAKLFLDFDGHYESSWGSWTNVSTPAFDQDGDKTSFSDGELSAIYEVWARVAEDYAPFNIDVTTEDPGNQKNKVTAVIAIGGNYSDWYGSSAGGVAFVGGFYNSSSNVGYVFEDALGSNAKYVAEASSHEAGHLFGLRHQSVWSGTTLVSAYNSGSGDWAPIMGNSYGAARSTWHNGTTNQSSTTYQDDIAVIEGSNNGFGRKGDDYGNTTASASNLAVNGTSVNFAGLIGQNTDVDMWKFTTGGGQVSFALAVAQFGANLDAVLELWDASNNVLASSNPSNSFGASLAATVGAGTHYLVARSSGGYGNVGQYTITGSLPGQTSAPEISVSESGVNLSDGGSLGFGTTTVGTAVTRTFTVTNDGSATLTLTQLAQSSMPAGFTLASGLGSTSLAPGQSTTFSIRLDAATAGSPSGTVSLGNNDADENPFDIAISGTVQAVSSSLGKKYDFGTLSSPVETDYTPVYDHSSYTSALGYGWVSGYISGANRTGGTALTRDLNQTIDGTFVANVSSGTYAVSLTMGDASYHHDQVGVFLEGMQVDTVTTAVGEFVTRTYQVAVSDGQLTLRLKDFGGSDANAVINGLTITSLSGSAASPPSIQSLSASPTTVAPGGQITLTGNGVTDPDGDLAKVRFYRDANGNGTLETGTDILVGEDTSGSDGWSVAYSTANLAEGSYAFLAVAEDQGGRASAAVSAAAIVQTSDSSFSRKFDFGTLSSPVETGYTPVYAHSSYSSASGYGWLSGYLSGVDQNSGTAVARDMNYTIDGTFAADVPSGTYAVTLTMGDTTYHHDNAGIYLEGTLMDTVTPVIGQYTTKTYQVNVSDGQLTLRLKDLGGSDPNAIINGLQIEAIGNAVAHGKAASQSRSTVRGGASSIAGGPLARQALAPAEMVAVALHHDAPRDRRDRAAAGSEEEGRLGALEAALAAPAAAAAADPFWAVPARAKGGELSHDGSRAEEGYEQNCDRIFSQWGDDAEAPARLCAA